MCSLQGFTEETLHSLSDEFIECIFHSSRPRHLCLCPTGRDHCPSNLLIEISLFFRTVPATRSSKSHFSSARSLHLLCRPACVSWSCDISLEHPHVASGLRETLNCCKVEQRMVLLRVARLGLCPSSRLSPYLDRCNVFLKKMYVSG